MWKIMKVVTGRTDLEEVWFYMLAGGVVWCPNRSRAEPERVSAPAGAPCNASVVSQGPTALPCLAQAPSAFPYPELCTAPWWAAGACFSRIRGLVPSWYNEGPMSRWIWPGKISSTWANWQWESERQRRQTSSCAIYSPLRAAGQCCGFKPRLEGSPHSDPSTPLT